LSYITPAGGRQESRGEEGGASQHDVVKVAGVTRHGIERPTATSNDERAAAQVEHEDRLVFLFDI
jgi:hypothetical protein